LGEILTARPLNAHSGDDLAPADSDTHERASPYRAEGDTNQSIFQTQTHGPIVTHPVEAGDPAPHFSLPTSSGKTADLAEFAGKSLVMFFYPKDDTSVCTREAVDFSDRLTRFTRRKAAVLGVSRDPLTKHARFIEKHNLKVRLASDEDGAACEAFGVWREKTLYGRKFMGIVRSTFLIGPDGRLRHVWRNVRVPDHADAVLEALEAIR
jgi:thioredoxin-dependent peroxiredoxin